jgi:chromosome segregation ATPase
MDRAMKLLNLPQSEEMEGNDVDPEERRTLIQIQQTLGGVTAQLENAEKSRAEMAQNVERSRTEMMQRLEVLSARIDPLVGLEGSTNLRFLAMHDRLNSIQVNFLQDDKRFAAMEQEIHDQEKELHQQDKRITQLESVERDLRQVDKRVEELQAGRKEHDGRISQLEYSRSTALYLLNAIAAVIGGMVVWLVQWIVRKLA